MKRILCSLFQPRSSRRISEFKHKDWGESFCPIFTQQMFSNGIDHDANRKMMRTTVPVQPRSLQQRVMSFSRIKTFQECLMRSLLMQVKFSKQRDLCETEQEDLKSLTDQLSVQQRAIDQRQINRLVRCVKIKYSDLPFK